MKAGDTKKEFQVGDRVVVSRIRGRGGEFGGGSGIIVCLPGEGHGVPPHLYVVSLDDGTIQGIDATLLEPST